MDQIQFAVRIKYATLVIGLPIIAIAALLYFKYVPTATAAEVIAVVISGIALLTLLYSVLNHHQSNQIHLEQLRLQKITQAMVMIDHYSAPDMAILVRTCIDLRKEIAGKTGREVFEIIEESQEKHSAVVAVLNYFESLGIVVRMNGADERMLREYYAPVIHRYWNAFNEWILLKRNEQGTQDMFSEFEYLVNRWLKAS